MTARRSALVALVLTVPLALLICGVLIVAGVMGGFQEDEGNACDGGSKASVEARGVGGLTSAQLANASTIITEGMRLRVPTQGIVIALAVANQESHFTNYANDGKGGDLLSIQAGLAASLRVPHEAVGSDHGSLGVFQQQWPWWGSMQQLMTPAVAAHKFYEALLSFPTWQSEPVTVAAQAVQGSAFPDAYADDEPLARELLGASGSANDSTAQDVVAGDCDVLASPGEVVFPLPARSGYRDNHNFGNRGGHWASYHTGDDFSVACGTAVLAATSGKVVVVTGQSWAGRWLVQVSTGTGQLTTWYAHMRALSVSDGESVRAGQQIGQVGDLGNATGCHLHFEVHPRGGSIYQDSVDPSAWLSKHIGPDGGVDHTVRSASWATDGEAFTVATFNTLGSSHTARGGKNAGMASGPERTRGVVRILEHFKVDVVGLQEFQRPQAQAFAALAGGAYQVWHPPSETPENAVAFRRDRWRLVGAGSISVPYFNGHARRMPVIRLRDRVSGADVTFLNVHNPADTRQFRNQGRWRHVAVTKEIALTRDLSSTGSPVIMTGDLNDRREAFCRLTSLGGMHSSNGGRGSPCAPARHSGIDWILGSTSIQFSDHTVDRDQLVHRTTDHPVVIARARVAP